jgi:hypothetical protein
MTRFGKQPEPSLGAGALNDAGAAASRRDDVDVGGRITATPAGRQMVADRVALLEAF